MIGTLAPPSGYVGVTPVASVYTGHLIDGLVVVAVMAGPQRHWIAISRPCHGDRGGATLHCQLLVWWLLGVSIKVLIR